MKLNRNLIYVTKDIERALGLKPGKYGDFSYIIVTNSTPYSELIKQTYPDFVITVDNEQKQQDQSGDTKDTTDLLEIITKREAELPREVSVSNSDFLVFKNNPLIDRWKEKNNISLLNINSAIGEIIENKTTQIKWLEEDAQILPPHKIKRVVDISYNDFNEEPFVLQWAHSHTGLGTILIENDRNLKEIKEKFPQREARITKFINGPVFTQNIAVNREVIFMGNISYQITGLLPFTENKWSTVGNDWSYPNSTLSPDQLEEIKVIGQKIAKRMQNSGWKGLFGVDIIFDEERNEVKLLEINARQPASTSYESILQTKNRDCGIDGYTTFESHIITLLDMDIEKDRLIEINDGAQIIQRVKEKSSIIHTEDRVKRLIESGFAVIKYENTKFNRDLLRIQSDKGIMESHNKLNERGLKIKEILS